MIGAKFDLVGDHTVVKGLPWSFGLERKFAGQPLDLTGCSARFVVSDVLDLAAEPHEFTVAGGQVALGGVLGTVDIDLPEAATAALPSRARYRLYFTDALGREMLLLRGQLAVVEE